MTALTASVWVKSSHSAAHFHTGSGWVFSGLFVGMRRSGTAAAAHVPSRFPTRPPVLPLLFGRNVFTAAWWILLLRCGEASRSEGSLHCVGGGWAVRARLLLQIQFEQ